VGGPFPSLSPPWQQPPPRRPPCGTRAPPSSLPTVVPRPASALPTLAFICCRFPPNSASHMVVVLRAQPLTASALISRHFPLPRALSGPPFHIHPTPPPACSGLRPLHIHRPTPPPPYPTPPPASTLLPPPPCPPCLPAPASLSSLPAPSRYACWDPQTRRPLSATHPRPYLPRFARLSCTHAGPLNGQACTPAKRPAA
jgi:hypothetical protein